MNKSGETLGKVLYSEFESIESVISSMADNPVLKKAVQRSTLFKFWESILPDKFKNTSRPFSMLPKGVMVIACKNSVVAQELSLNKILLIKKIYPYMKSLNIDVRDLKFDPKKWI